MAYEILEPSTIHVSMLKLQLYGMTNPHLLQHRDGLSIQMPMHFLDTQQQVHKHRLYRFQCISFKV